MNRSQFPRSMSTGVLGRGAAVAALAAVLLAGPLTAGWGLEEGAGGLTVTGRPVALPDLSLPGALQLGSAYWRGWFDWGAGGDQAAGAAAAPLRITLKPGRKLTLDGLVFLGQGATGRRALASTRPGASLSGGPQLDLLAPTRETRATGSRVYSYRLDYGTGPLQLRGSFMDVGAGFNPSGEALQGAAPEDLKQLREALGKRKMELTAAWKLLANTDLTSRYLSVRNDKPGDDNQGLTTTDLEHIFALALGGGSRLQASLKEHSEDWDESLGRQGVTRRTSGVEFTTGFGNEDRHGLRLALTSVTTKQGEEEKDEKTTEAHLHLSPSGRLQLTADYVSKERDNGEGQTTQQVSAVMKLAPDARLAATLKTVTPNSGSQTQESSLQLDTKLGGGASAGQFSAEQKTVRVAGQGMTNYLKAQFAGSVGKGPSQTNVQALLQQSAGDDPSDPMSRFTKLHVDRALTPRAKLSADREEQQQGTREQLSATVKSRCALAADLDPHTKVTAGFGAQHSDTEPENSDRDVAIRREAGPLLLEAQQQLARRGEDGTAVTRYAMDLHRGDLPDWARNISHEHAFGDAAEFLVPREPDWLDMGFSGLRLLSKQRRGGADDGLDTLAAAQRLVIARRFHLLMAFERCPEARDGDRRGRPMPLTRELIEIGTPVGRGLVARGRYTTEASLLDAESRRGSAALGLWGRLSDNEQVEASVSRETSTWDGAGRDCTSVAVLYSHRLDDEHEVSVKVGYSWGQQNEGEAVRDYRLALRYAKPI